MIKFYENDIKFPKNDILRCSVPTFAQNIWVEIFLESGWVRVAPASGLLCLCPRGGAYVSFWL